MEPRERSTDLPVPYNLLKTGETALPQQTCRLDLRWIALKPVIQGSAFLVNERPVLTIKFGAVNG